MILRSQRTASPSPIVTVVDEPDPLISFIYVTFGTDVAIVIESLQRLASSLLADAVPAEVIVVDNLHPTLGHRVGQDLALRTSGVRLVQPADNLGFGGGNELGILHARGAILCLINPDLMVHDGWLTPMLDLLAEHPRSVVAPRLLNRDGTLQEAGQLVGTDGMTVPAAAGQSPEYASAACWLMRRGTHEHVGGFDPRFHPAYFEDVDFAFRLRRRGAAIVVHPALGVVHVGGASTDSSGTRSRQRAGDVTDVRAQLDVFTGLWRDQLRRQANA